MTKKNNPAGDVLGREFIITREFAAPRELVWRACTESAHLAQWWGPKGFTAPVCEWDVRPGGKIYVLMRGPDGTDYPMGGEVREIDPPRRLVTMNGALDEKGKFLFQILHVMTLAESGGKTKLTMHSRVIEATAGAGKYIGGFEMGMTLSLERLAGLLEQLTKNMADDPPAQNTADREIVITRDFDAPRELCWEAMTNPKHVVNWWGPRGFTTTIETMDFREGGVWKHVMKGPDGAKYPNKSTFKKIVKPERIEFLHGGGHEEGPGATFHATWTFEALAADRTRVTARMVFPSAEMRNFVVKEFGAIEGGKQTLERLGEYLPKLAAQNG